MSTFETALSAAQELSASERQRLVDAILETIPADQASLPSEEWIAAAQRRSAAFDRGEMTASSWPAVRERARKQAGLDA